MSFDGIFTKAVVDEIYPLLLNGKINKINQPDKNEINIQIYNKENYKLLKSKNIKIIKYNLIIYLIILNINYYKRKKKVHILNCTFFYHI